MLGVVSMTMSPDGTLSLNASPAIWTFWARYERVRIPFENFTPMMGGEDFAYFLEACKGAYIILGQGKTDSDPGLHSPHYDFNDEVLPVGAAYWVRLAETWLAKKS